MEDMLGLVVRSIILSLFMGMSCQAFYETVVPRRKLQYGWIEYTTVLAFAAGFMVIAVTKIPPYIFQPVRVIVVSAVIAQIYFQMRIVKNLILAIVFCGLYWLASILFVLVVNITPMADYVMAANMAEPILDIGYLCLMLAFRYRYRNRVHGLTDIKWGKFGLFSLIGIAVSIAVAIMSQEGSTEDYYARLTAVAGFAVVYVLV